MRIPKIGDAKGLFECFERALEFIGVKVGKRGQKNIVVSTNIQAVSNQSSSLSDQN